MRGCQSTGDNGKQGLRRSQYVKRWLPTSLASGEIIDKFISSLLLGVIMSLFIIDKKIHCSYPATSPGVV